MKLRISIGFRAIACGLAALVMTAVAQAQTSISFKPFGSLNASQAELDAIVVEGLIVATGNGVSIRISNASNPAGGTWVNDNRPTITRIFFEDSAGVLNAAATPIGNSQGGVSFTPNNQLTGALNGNFTVENGYWATPPPVQNGLDPNEWVEFNFVGSSYNDVVAAFASSGARIGMHIQEIGSGGQASQAFINSPIPEPSIAMLGLLGIATLIRRRR